MSEYELRETLERSFVTSAGTRATVFAAAEERGRTPRRRARRAGGQARHPRRVARGRALAGACARPPHRAAADSNARAREARRARRRRRARILGSAVAVIVIMVVAALGGGTAENEAAEGCADARGAQISASCSRTPDIVGASSASEAELLLERVDLNLGPRVRTRVEAEVDAGTVLEQSPAAGSIVDKGDEVSIVVAVGPQRVTVPQLRDLRLEAADERLRSPVLSAAASRGAQGRRPRRAGPDPGRRRRRQSWHCGRSVPARSKAAGAAGSHGGDIGDRCRWPRCRRHARRSQRRARPRAALRRRRGSPQLATERQAVSSLAAGRSIRMEIHMPYTARARLQPIVVSVTVDPENKIRERNEDNNGDRTAPLPRSTPRSAGSPRTSSGRCSRRRAGRPGRAVRAAPPRA